MKPIGVTMGDASGVGPEILLMAADAGELPEPFVVYGDRAVLGECGKLLGSSLPIRASQGPEDVSPGCLNVIDHGLLDADAIRPGQISKASGAAAREYVVSACRAAQRGEIAAMVTLPMNKEATRLSDPNFTGHTELIGSLCGVDDVTIMLVADSLIVTHVSTHCSLREAIERCREARIFRIIELTVEALRRISPGGRIAVAGLNPHASEHGLFGSEESAEIEPAIARARACGWPVDGPFPPDTVFYLAARKREFEAVVAMYHDQGHIPAKLLDFEGGVNVSLGLPIIRTSVDHGTAFDIAWQGKASTRSFREAFRLALRLSGGEDSHAKLRQ
ncbi:MAG: 4-hydroxythreonine-4-phosphate dehydrogenase PdxA [Bryobacterales bacterium]|nr:4-hydroxythreonine-4-phosphate dehydrogenase PdxA [Bryobacterales bacterium]